MYRTIRKARALIDLNKRIPNMSLGELPECLVHEECLIRSKAQIRMKELQSEAQGHVWTPRWRSIMYGLDSRTIVSDITKQTE